MMNDVNTTNVTSGMTHQASLRAVWPKRTLFSGTSTVAMGNRGAA